MEGDDRIMADTTGRAFHTETKTLSFKTVMNKQKVMGILGYKGAELVLWS